MHVQGPGTGHLLPELNHSFIFQDNATERNNYLQSAVTGSQPGCLFSVKRNLP